MALTATMYRFELNVSDVDRGFYDTVELRVAQHPSESEPYLVTRVLAMALEYRDDLKFGRGISTPDDPSLSAPDMMGGIDLWIEVGQPSADRLHKVTKQANTTKIYTHKDPSPLEEALRSGEIHRGDDIVLVAIDPGFIEDLAHVLTRNARWDVLRSDGVLYVTSGDATFETPIVERRFAQE
jgi:uncharacterized protein YaeQ